MLEQNREPDSNNTAEEQPTIAFTIHDAFSAELKKRLGGELPRNVTCALAGSALVGKPLELEMVFHWDENGQPRSECFNGLFALNSESDGFIVISDGEEDESITTYPLTPFATEEMVEAERYVASQLAPMN